ncbi:Hypothetical predicted protein [Paramuricea clavata]|uniref:Uncharacterized protein n=1 Tax=Paramuricea clavata TaxID=317549 RepID=A0A7D9LZJ9_PARCT|nr:Hypothetical predicted protein [Paramuricea clavata]
MQRDFEKKRPIANSVTHTTTGSWSIPTIENKTLIHKSINKGWDLTQFLIEAAQMENIKRQVSDITSPEVEVKARVNREAQTPKPRQRDIARNGGHQAVRRAGSCFLDNSVHYTDQWFSLANTKWLFIFSDFY